MIALGTGIEIAYDDTGKGTPVVFLHGFPHNRELWAPQLSALDEHARCIAPDLRGFGESGAGEGEPFSMDRYADDVADLLHVLRIPKAVICGLSMGGYVAFAFVRRHRDRLRGLVLVDTKAGADSEEAREKRRAMIDLARQKGSDAVADSMIGGMVGKSTREKNPEIVDAVHRLLASAPVEGIVGALQAMMDRPDSTDTLATIDVPTLIVVGEEDILTPPKEARAMHEAIRGSTLQEIAGAGHVSNLERPATFNRLMTEYLVRLQAS